MFEFLIIAWVAWQFTNLLVQDGIHAVKGTTPPRHTERMARIARGEQVPQRYGIGGYLRDLLDDALRADVERRRRKRRDATEASTQAPTSSGGQQGEPPLAEPFAGGEVPDPDAGPPLPTEPVDVPARQTQPDDDDLPRAEDNPFYAYMDQRRCVARVSDRPHGLCGEPTNTDTQRNGWDNNPHCTTHTHQWADGPAPNPADEPTARVYQFPTPPDVPAQPAGDNMPETTTPDGTTEVTGLASAVHYAKGVAAAHQSHGSGEAYVASLRGFEVGEGDVALVEAAQEASRNAAAKWQTAADALLNHNAAVREAYQASGGEAGNKQFATSE